MAIRIENRLTFIHIGKCGGISMTNVLDQRFHTEHSAARHDLYNELPDTWRDCVFCIIRNPFDRLLSLYNFSIKKYQKRKQTDRLRILDKGFENYVMNEYDRPWYGDIGGWQNLTQSRYFPTDTSLIHCLRLETLNQDRKQFCTEHDLTYYPVGRNNTSRTNNSYRDHYTPAMQDVVKDRWAAAIRLGNYEF